MLNWLYDLFSKISSGWFMVVLIICLAVGVLLLVKGADLFVSGASQFAKKLKIPTIIIGLTVVSFGTSAPEASVSITAAINNNAAIAVGNVVGSNICNILLILGLSALFAPIVLDKKQVKTDILIMIGVAILLLLFYFIIDINGNKGLSLVEGIILFAGIITYVIYNILGAKKSTNGDFGDDQEEMPKPKPEAEQEQKPRKTIVVFLILAVGLGAILIGGDLVTYSASNIALKMGISEILIGLTIVAFCTSLPELVTSLVAALKKENDIAIGNVVGSNIFNILFILGVTSMISPLYFDSVVMIDIIIMVAVSIFVLVIYKIKGKINRNLGIIMILLYAAYIAYLILREFV